MEILWPRPTVAVALAPDKLDVWAVRIDGRVAAPDGLMATLSAEERERAEQFRLAEPTRRFVVSRAALRVLLGRYLKVPPAIVAIETEPTGKPRLGDQHSPSRLRFNVAHSGELALVAVAADCEVGVDVERLRPVCRAVHIAQRYFHSTEVEAIQNAAPSARDAAFMRCWTGKEAVLKAIGSGITASLATFCVPTVEFEPAPIEWATATARSSERCWLHALRPSPEYVAAVACIGADRDVRCFAF